MWEDICSLAPTSTNRNFIVLGDFNEIMDFVERKGLGIYLDIGLASFREIIEMSIPMKTAYERGLLYMEQ